MLQTLHLERKLTASKNTLLHAQSKPFQDATNASPFTELLVFYMHSSPTNTRCLFCCPHQGEMSCRAVNKEPPETLKGFKYSGHYGENSLMQKSLYPLTGWTRQGVSFGRLQRTLVAFRRTLAVHACSRLMRFRDVMEEKKKLCRLNCFDKHQGSTECVEHKQHAT